ncbi:P-type ATPase, partial [Cladochytrium tenue]
IAAAKDPAAAESGLTFVGLVGMIDPPKQGVRESIASCRHAGIKVIMITGDHAATAAAIATQLGILDPGSAAHSRVMKGAELDMLSEEALADARPFPSVFARVSPDNKLKIVRALQRRGRFVAMTGDGVNDAPAIKQADVGVAMGRAGTEITKQAADVVLEDDDFNTVVAAVREGRLVFDNIKKFIVYLLSCNGAEILLFLAAAIGNIETPFSTIQILWANIIADIPPAMSIGVEPEEVNIMDRPPRDPKEGVLTAATWLVILAQALTQSLLTLAAYLLSLHGYIPGVDTLRRQRSLAFAALTTMQLGQAFLSRSVELSVFVTGVTGNWWMVGCVLGSFAAMLFGIYIPGLDDWLELEGPGSEWYVIVACVVVQLAAVELTKLALRAHLRRRRAAAAAAADSARAS